MNEKAVLGLVAHAVRQVLREYGAAWNEKDEELVAEHIADIAWTALIVGAREALSRGEPVVLAEFGRFELKGNSWQFEAAESLQAAAAVSLPATKGNQLLAEKALYLLSTATEIARRVPPDTYVGLSPEEKLLQEIFSEEKIKRKFSDLIQEKLRALGVQFQSQSEFVSDVSLGRVDPSIKPYKGSLPKIGDGIVSLDYLGPEKIYEGTVTQITDKEAFVEVMPGRTGSLHFSQIPNASKGTIDQHLKVGQRIKVRVIEDLSGEMRLSTKSVSGDLLQQGPSLSAG
jgi:hypothetical protein